MALSGLRIPFQIDGSERRKGEDKGIRAALSGVISGLLATEVAGVRTAVVDGVSVHDFAVEAGFGDAETIAATDYGCGVDDGDDEVFGFLAAADEGKDAIVGVVCVNPFKTVPVKFDLMEGRLGGVQMIEIGNEALDAAVGIVLEEMPVEAASFAPFAALGQFLAHEQELLAWVGALIGEEQAEIGELLPHIAGHFVEERVFSVNDLIVGEGKKEILREGVQQREG